MDELKLRVITWNVNARTPPENFSCQDFLGSKETLEKRTYDMYVVGFQEVSARVDNFLLDTFVTGEDPWTTSVKNRLSPYEYIKVRSYRLLGIVISLFCLKHHLVHLRNIETQHTRLSLGGYWGFKGAVSIRLELYGVSYCFVCTHLSAHDNLLEQRVNEYNTIIDGHTYKSQVQIKSEDINFQY